MRLRSLCIFALLLFVPLYSQDWPTLQNTLLKFYRYQRAGLVPTTANSTGNPYNPFYTHTSTLANDNGKYPHWGDGGSTPLDGGWYDAGDFVKFGLPLGFSVYCLLKGYDAFGDPACYDDNNSLSAIGTKDNIPDVLNEAKVATDYLIKAVISSSQVVRDVGSGPTDHSDMADGYSNSNRTFGTQNRPISYCDGADVPGFYAAALALMSILYKQYDATYSATCLSKAILAYTFGNSHLKTCTEQPDPNNPGGYYYSTPTYTDKMACAAIELYRATKTATYMTATKTFLSGMQQHYDVVGYAHCSDFAVYELYRQGDNSSQGYWSSDISLEMTRVVKMGANYVGGATVNTTDWGVCRTVGNSAFSAALLYTISGNVALKNYVTQQIKWLAGMSPFSRSWITQYGSPCPQNPHSRNDVNLKQFARLTGGVVSGPTSAGCVATDKSTCTWTFNDNSGEYKNTECALDYGCGAIGAAAFLRWVGKTIDTIRIDSPLVATPQSLDLATQSETITGAIDKAVAWKVILQGQSSKAIKTYTGTGPKISIQGWNGSQVDAGSPSFTVEKVIVYMDTTSMKIWDLQRGSASQTSFNITNIPSKPWGANDKEVDNFNDADILTNMVGGKWSGFCDVSDGVAGAKSSAPILSADIGSDASKALYFTLTRSAGATAGGGPYAGVKTTFTASGSSVDLGPADTIMFDCKPLAANSSLTVELEQSDITDKTFFGRTIQLGSSAWVRLYVPLATLAQPAWKTTAKTLNTKKAASIRFVGYGAGSDRYLIDNLRISNLSITANAVHGGAKRIALNNARNVEFYSVSPSMVTYAIFFKGVEGKTISAELFDCLGKSITSYRLSDYKTGSTVFINGFTLHTGIYFLKHTVIDSKKTVIVPFMVTK